MTSLQSLFLGVLQGFTELLPISSSGHLALAERFLHVSIPQGMLGFDVLLHAGSLLALLLCYARTWVRILSSPFTRDARSLRLFLLLILVTLPAGIVGVLFGEALDSLRSLPELSLGFFISGMVLLLAEYVPGRRDASTLTLFDVLLIGIAQACALVPSVSRSGMTVSAGRALGLHRSSAVDFAFLMAVPAIAGASLFTVVEVLRGSLFVPSFSVSLVGFLASFGASVLAIFLLRAFARRHSLAWFAAYLFPIAAILLAL